MISSGQIREFIPRDYDVFVGMDVDKTKMAVTFLNQEKTVKSLQIPNDANNLLGYMRKNFSGQKAIFVYEAGPTGYKIHDQILKAGYPCLVVAPSMVPTPPGKHVKTNRLDSQKLAESLRGGQLKSIRVPSAPYRQLRHLVNTRDTFARQAQATQCRIKALLLFEGVSFPDAPEGSQWSRSVIKTLKGLDLNPGARFKMDRLLDNLDFARQQALKTIREIRCFCTQEPDLKRCIGYLMTMPGLGWITASHLLARIGDWRLLHNVRELASFLGLAQREDSTGEDIRRGSITRAGDSRLRSKLIQAAWAAIRKDPELQEFYKRIYSNHHKDKAARKAIVAVARKMTMRIHAVLAEQRPYVIHGKISSDSLTQEETVCPRGRLDDGENQENLDSPDGSFSETETPGPFIPGNSGRLAQQKRTRPGIALEEAHLKTVRGTLLPATHCSKSILRLTDRGKDEKKAACKLNTDPLVERMPRLRTSDFLTPAETGIRNTSNTGPRLSSG